MASNKNFKLANDVSIKTGIIQRADGSWITSVNDVFAYLWDCGCFGYDCCTGTMKLQDVSGNGKDYIWNDNGALVFGTKEEAIAAYKLRNA
jgi:hypothetical protein